jgi:tRNA A-37 threonylcarbamoyl transferase component Bud32
MEHASSMLVSIVQVIAVVAGVVAVVTAPTVAVAVFFEVYRLLKGRPRRPQAFAIRLGPGTGDCRVNVDCPVSVPRPLNRGPQTAAATPQTNRCPECGSPIEGNLPGGLCPRCLLKGALNRVESEERPATAAYADAGTAPTPAELAGRFPQLEILELLGRGGMGAVYKARQTKLDRLVALKILTPEAGNDPAFAERFAREARAMARLNHPNIVTVHDFGEAGGLYYFVMEYVDGVNLRQMLQAGQVQPQEAMRVVPQLCAALQYAHEEGVVHRDIKPENILVDRRGAVKIADFGLAKLLGRSTADYKLTGSQQVMGTPHYMAPEQIDHPLAVDHRADIYALGVVFYEMLTGELPLGRFPPPSQKAPVDARLDEVVLRTLDRDPAHRYQQVSEFRTAVEAILEAPLTKAVVGVAQALRISLQEAVALPAIVLCLVVVALGLWGTESPLALFGLPFIAHLATLIEWNPLGKLLAGLILAAGGLAVMIFGLTFGLKFWWVFVVVGLWYSPYVYWFFGEKSDEEKKEEQLGARAAAAVGNLTGQEAVIAGVLKRFESAANIYLPPDLPGEGLHTARKSCGVPDAERVLGLIDLTGEDEMSRCVLFGNTAVFFNTKRKKEEIKGAIAYAEFPERTFVNHGKAVYLGQEQFLYVDPDECGVDGETLANLLNALRETVPAGQPRPNPEQPKPVPEARDDVAARKSQDPASEPAAATGPSQAFGDLSAVLKHAALSAALKHLGDAANSSRAVPRRVTRGVARVLKRFQDSASLYLGSNMPAEGLQNARRSCAVPPSEHIHGLIDFTGDEDDMRYSCLFGAAGIYYRVKGAEREIAGAIPYAEFPNRVFVNHGKAVYLGQEQYLPLDPDESPVDGETLTDLLNALREVAIADQERRK